MSVISKRRASDEHQFEALYRQEYPRMVALAASLCGDKSDAAEIAQEALLRALRQWTKVSGLERPGAWVRRVTINLAIDAHRKRASRAAAQQISGDSLVSTERGYGVDDRFWFLVRDLPERQRSVVALRYVDDLSLDDIARVLDMPLGTVKSTLHAAQRSLAKSLPAKETN